MVVDKGDLVLLTIGGFAIINYMFLLLRDLAKSLKRKDEHIIQHYIFLLGCILMVPFFLITEKYNYWWVYLFGAPSIIAVGVPLLYFTQKLIKKSSEKSKE
jgi:hypothetical protein